MNIQAKQNTISFLQSVIYEYYYIGGWVQDCIISSALELEIQKSFCKPSTQRSSLTASYSFKPLGFHLLKDITWYKGIGR